MEPLANLIGQVDESVKILVIFKMFLTFNSFKILFFFIVVTTKYSKEIYVIV